MASAVLPYCCGLTLLLIAVGGVALFSFGASERSRFDPLFQDIVCEPYGSHLSKLKLEAPKNVPNAEAQINAALAALQKGGNGSFDLFQQALPLVLASNITADGWIARKCKNQNQMTFSVSTHTVGTIYLYEIKDNGTHNVTTLRPAGESSLPLSTLPAEGSGVSNTSSIFRLDMLTVLGLLGQKEPSMFVTKSFWRSGTHFTMLRQKVETSSDSENWCGFRAFVENSTLGPAACADKLEDLIIPSIWAQGGIDVISISDAKREEGESQRDMACGLVMAIGAAIAAVCACCAGILIRRGRRAGLEQGGDPDARVKGAECSEVPLALISVSADVAPPPQAYGSNNVVEPEQEPKIEPRVEPKEGQEMKAQESDDSFN
mmetsp:Transcript_71514/g.232409  ORF Transcript_71514/g.232409 Transcript_71514/m.232409 type:complete len:376 (-) Transcript_71514:123-1250(-)